MFEEIRTVVFDFGGVLVDLCRERAVDTFRRLGFPQAEQMLDLYHPSGLFSKLECGLISGHELCGEIRRIANRPIPDEAVRDAYLSFLETIPVAKLRAIRALRGAGIRTYGLSNINEFVMPYVREVLFRADGLKMEDYLIHAYLSYEMKLLKPDPAIFRRMVAHSGMKPETTLFIDDGPRNVETARTLGFQVYMPAPREDFTPLLREIETAARMRK